MRHRAVAALTVGLSLLPAAARPQESLTRGEQRTFNFAFAHRLGSGIYEIDGRTVQIYRLPLRYTLRQEEPGRFGVRIGFPVTLGFYDFRATDLPEAGLPDDIDSASLVPEVALRFLVKPDWLLQPFVEAGFAWDGDGDADAGVYALGLDSRARFAPGGGFEQVVLGNSLSAVRVDPRRPGLTSDDLVVLESAVEARRPLPLRIARHGLDLGLYGSVDVYLDDGSFPFQAAAGSTTGAQYELGVTFGTVEPLRLWRFELPRLGLGYRFGSGLSSVRLVIGLPARSLEP